ncbi:MAG: HDIG domain-containing protein [Muribaculaceae bacterium]|nr:HDIG domain-containing protein [Muribaculaceae bacterium]
MTSLLQRSKYLWQGLLGAATVALIVLCFPQSDTTHFKYEEGRPWNYAKLIAPFDIPVHPDSATLRRMRDTLDAHFVPVYRINQQVVDSIVGDLPSGQWRQATATRLRRAYASGVVDADTRRKVSSGRLPRVRVLDRNVLSEMSTSAFSSPADVYKELDSTCTDSTMRRYMAMALPTLLRPNIEYDSTESRRHYEYDYLTLTADRGVIQQGQTIVDKGTLITPQDFTNLRTYESMIHDQLRGTSSSDTLMLLGRLLYVLICVAMLSAYYHFFCPAIDGNPRAWLFAMSLLVLFFLLSALLERNVYTGIYLVPVPVVAALMLAFFDGRTAIVTAMAVTLLCAALSSFPLEYFFLQISASGAAVYSLREVSRRSQMLRASAFVAAVYLITYPSIELMFNGSFDGWSWRMVIFLCCSAALVQLSYVLMFAAERAFGFVSRITLVELADSGNPLLRRLSDECPGTFQHSLAVSNLAADAARVIDADTMLVRAGAMYHDIGKLRNPAFFTENQHGINPHDTLPPEQSARIITSHVTDGLRLADKAGLPSVVRDFIAQHHGRGMAKYFYIMACRNAENAGEPAVDTAPFTYVGPNPLTREASVLMMADSVEAASRSLREYTTESITELVNRIIDSQIADGLHDESTLSFRDVPAIKQAFIKRLKTMYHARVAYPPAGTNTAPK